MAMHARQSDPGLVGSARRSNRVNAVSALRRLASASTGVTRAALLGLALTAPAVPAAGEASKWTGTWATALTPASPADTGRSLSGFEDESIRMLVQPSIGGHRMRVRLSNAHGEGYLLIGRATVARPEEPSAPDLRPHTVRALTFGGDASVTIPPGEEVLSDPVNMFVFPLTRLAVTVYLPEATGPRPGTRSPARPRSSTAAIMPLTRKAATTPTPRSTFTFWPVLKSTVVTTARDRSRSWGLRSATVTASGRIPMPGGPIFSPGGFSFHRHISGTRAC